MNRPFEPYPPTVVQDSADPRNMRTFTHILYALYAFYWLSGGLTGLVAIILNYIKRGDAAGTPYEDHFTWQIRTFWWSVLGHIIGFALIWVLGLGFLILGVAWVWTLYRIIKGWLYLYENKTLDPRAWF
jgi:uncharacterized membrane protein